MSILLMLGAGKRQLKLTDSKYHLLTNTDYTSFRWIINIFKRINVKVCLVLGHQSGKLSSDLQDCTYIINEDWDSTGPAYSLLKSSFEKDHDYFVSYTDIVYGESAVSNLLNMGGDIIVTGDSEWLNRYHGRLQEDISSCEKIISNKDSVIKLGVALPQKISEEFVGLILLKKNVIEYLDKNKAFLQKEFKNNTLTELIEYLRINNFEVNKVDISGSWAELNDSRDLARFILKTKAQALLNLKTLLKHSIICDQFTFKINDWESNKDLLIKKISEKFEKVIIRSSSHKEDNFNKSNAGLFESVLNVHTSDSVLLEKAINKVLDTYVNSIGVDEVLVQPMLKDIVTNGVVMTRCLNTSAPYYVLNYQHGSGSDDITSGKGTEVQTTYILKNINEFSNYNDFIKLIITAVREIESLVDYDSLDIEFAITSRGDIYIFQVRPISANSSSTLIDDNSIFSKIKLEQNNFENLNNNLHDAKINNLYGVMPDWNPAEILGIRPNRLAASLYSKLIMNDVWSQQRFEFGYKDMRPNKLLYNFCGHTYVNVKSSLKSFIPYNLSKSVTDKYLKYNLNWLLNKPEYHDKIEFEVLPTCFDLNHHKWRNRYVDSKILKIDEYNSLIDNLKVITRKAKYKVDSHLSDIEILNKKNEKYNLINNPLTKINLLINDCKRYGTLPFAHLARNCFISMRLLNSAVEIDALDSNSVSDFILGLHTVSKELIVDSYNCSNRKITWSEFKNKYGHLRNGTYDINYLSYAEDSDFYLKPLLKNRTSNFHKSNNANSLWEKNKSNFEKLLIRHQLFDNIDEFEIYAKKSIEGREYAKFVFSKNITKIFDEIIALGKGCSISRNMLSFFSINEILDQICYDSDLNNFERFVHTQIENRKEIHSINSLIELPPLISDKEDFVIFSLPENVTNFIGHKSEIAEIVYITPSQKNNNLVNKIVFIENADPGYDWIFGYNIKGLITKYGGANSHMAIRAAENNVLAALGVGEKNFNSYISANRIELNSEKQFIRVIN
jgi:glutamine kinase